MIRWFWSYITTPSDYPGDPCGFALNQLGHAWIVGAAIGLCAAPEHIWIWMMAYVVVIEIPQTLLWGGLWSDGAEDSGHVLLGAISVSTGEPMIAAAQLLLLASGTLARKQ